MPLAIETVIIVVIVVSFTILCVIAFAVYWLWRLFLEDRRCSTFESTARRPCHLAIPSYTPIVTASLPNERPSHRTSWRIPNMLDSNDSAPLTSHNVVPRIIRQNDVIVDERKRRMTKTKTQESNSRRMNSRCRDFQSSGSRTCAGGSTSTSEIVVVDGTEPPPPYEEVR